MCLSRKVFDIPDFRSADATTSSGSPVDVQHHFLHLCIWRFIYSRYLMLYTGSSCCPKVITSGNKYSPANLLSLFGAVYGCDPSCYISLLPSYPRKIHFQGFGSSWLLSFLFRMHKNHMKVNIFHFGAVSFDVPKCLKGFVHIFPRLSEQRYLKVSYQSLIPKPCQESLKLSSTTNRINS
ncbi:hypothetical protein KP509_13G000200 [Ceratopteris richardii]|uniref:Uncharacterized protein n=1 Tax=Ceratopteris richardii TaxID=49495 RepID=A0A8T2TEL9_CERRI|nr:hypothetical protein KP509_13G000200 [Ceratopteris richardii]